MSLWGKQWLVAAVVGMGILLAIVQNGRLLGGVGFFLIVAGLVMDVILIRCPKCGTWLGKYPGGYCSNCGTKIDWKRGKD